MAEQYSSLPNAFSKVITDLTDLIQKEMRLARAELSEKLSISIRAGVWMSVATALVIVAALLVVQASVLGLAGMRWAGASPPRQSHRGRSARLLMRSLVSSSARARL